MGGVGLTGDAFERGIGGRIGGVAELLASQLCQPDVQRGRVSAGERCTPGHAGKR